jgi:hypothetical protein
MGIYYQPLTAPATYRRITPQPYQSPEHGDPLIEACLADIVDSFPRLSAGKQHVLRFICLILRSL